MKILVTGAGGQVGRALRRAAENSVTARPREWLFFGSAELNIADRDSVERVVGEVCPDIVVNCAAVTDVDGAELGAEHTRAVNALGVGYLGEECRRRRAKIIHISTDYVFDGRGDKPYTEEDAVAPLGIYGATKLEGERLLIESGCGGAILRTSLVYSREGKNFVANILDSARRQDSIKVVDDQWSSPTFSGTLVRAIVKVADRFDAEGAAPYPAEIFNVADGGGASRWEIARLAVSLAGIDCRVEACRVADFPRRAARPRYSTLDCSKFERRFGFTFPSWQEALQECMEREQ